MLDAINTPRLLDAARPLGIQNSCNKHVRASQPAGFIQSCSQTGLSFLKQRRIIAVESLRRPPVHWAPRNNTVDQSHAIPVNLVEERNDDAMKAEGRKVVRRAQDTGLGGGGVSVVGDRRGPDLAEDTWGFTFLKNKLACLENEFQRSMADYARRLDKLEKEVDAIKRTVPKIASNNRLV